MSDSAVFEAFEAYDFNAQESFQSGLRVITEKFKDQSGPAADLAVEKAKWFYYSKFVKPFDYEAYRAWRRSRDGDGDAAQTATSATDGVTAAVDAVVEDGNKTSDVQEPHYPKTFAEICALVAQGKPIPGIREIPKTVYDPEKQSQPKMQPKKKPWE
ncbi:hypothetical protein HDU96_005625 [Phlyctochytrium bullatum]|nr:hypothetical protein HDU96_005625 [Phlyctochytrium bullatum]